MAHILAVVACGSSGLDTLSLPDLPKQLFAKFIVTYHRITLLAGSMVDFQDIFHVCDEVGILLGRDAPALLQPRLDFAFFNSSPTV